MAKKFDRKAPWVVDSNYELKAYPSCLGGKTERQIQMIDCASQKLKLNIAIRDFSRYGSDASFGQRQWDSGQKMAQNQETLLEFLLWGFIVKGKRPY